MEDMQKRIEALEAENAALRADLKHAFEIDTSNKEQAIDALKGKISGALKADADVFKALDGKEMDEDNYIAAMATLKRVFKSLKRVGIEI